MGFKSADEFVEVFDKLWTLIDEHPEVGPKLKAAKAPHRFVFSDLDLELNVTYANDGERNLRWVWGRDGCEWEPEITLTMKSDTANRYFQGKENVTMAVTFGRIKLQGPLSRILQLSPITRPVEPHYRDMLRAEGRDHLLA
jgi:hypothetical protein